MELLRPVAMAMAMGCSSSSSTPRTKAAGHREAGNSEEAGNSGEATDVAARRNRSGSSAVAGAPWPWRLSWEEEAWEREEVPKASDRTQVEAKEVWLSDMPPVTLDDIDVQTISSPV
ncbi:hypothetical protein ACQJBY_051122 [Aegilops geniculata]